MTSTEILRVLRQLTNDERLMVIEVAIHLIREDSPVANQAKKKKNKVQLAGAAEALLPDYAPGGELTAFTALDGEDFYHE